MARSISQRRTGFLKTALALCALAALGVALAMPYVLTLEGPALAAAAARKHIGIATLLTASLAQSAALIALCVFAGFWAAHKLGLGAPLLEACFANAPRPPRTASTLQLSIAVGFGVGAILVIADIYLFQRLSSVYAFVAHASASGIQPPRWQGFLASFYGALDEEILMRLGLLSLFALGLRTIARWWGADRNMLLPPAIFWAANILAALIFGAGHLPAVAAIALLTPGLIARTIVLNGVGGLVFGALYRRFGLEWAMASHFACDLVLHVFTG